MSGHGPASYGSTHHRRWSGFQLGMQVDCCIAGADVLVAELGPGKCIPGFHYTAGDRGLATGGPINLAAH